MGITRNPIHPDKMKTVQILLNRINEANDAASLRNLETTITRQHDAGTITAPELMRLDVRIMERLAILTA
jgi:hypothetical protein